MGRWLLVYAIAISGFLACSGRTEVDLGAQHDSTDSSSTDLFDLVPEVQLARTDLHDTFDASTSRPFEAIDDAELRLSPCSVDADCAAGLKCAPATGLCVECFNYLDCEDSNPCTFDFCGGDGLCVNKASEGECDDLDPCTIGDHCESGECLFDTELNCDDANQCTKDLCQEDGCYHGNLEGLCDDGDPCNLGDYCKIGTCVGGATKLKCDDANPCTVNHCEPFTGCQFEPAPGPCDDGDPCTAADQCSDGSCSGAPVDCGDGDACTSDVCIDGECEHAAPPAGDCEDDNGCTADSCDPLTGDCLHLPLPGGCDDGSLCTSDDQCVEGSCLGTPKDCDDDNDCTEDECDVTNGECLFQPLTGACDDGNLCTVGDQCVDGACQPGSGFPNCDDGNSCTGATCDPKGGCINDVLLGWPCDDGNACTQNDTCSLPADCLGELIVCQDEDPCTDDACDQQSGECLFPVATGAGCDDGDICTKKDVCQEDGGCAGVPKVCDDLNPCTEDSCEPEVGCVNTPIEGPC